MTSDPEPPVPDPEGQEFRDLSDAILNPGAGKSPDDEARKAADWILNTYLTVAGKPERAKYRAKVERWALSDPVLFGKLGTAVGSTALSTRKTECVGYWEGHDGSTMVWEMKRKNADDGKFAFAGVLAANGKVVDIGLFDVTGVHLGNDPGDGKLKANGRWILLGANPAYDQLINDILKPIQDGTYVWPVH